MKKLPVGISTFSDIRKGDFVYVDKTPWILHMLEGRYYFLSRPRRFGKSLLVSTIKEMFSGDRELFQGLAAYDKWDFEPHPVIEISFGKGITRSADKLAHRFKTLVQRNSQNLGVSVVDSDDVVDLFSSLIEEVCAKYQKGVVILVDEYDKPILDNLTTAAGPEIRDELRNIYSVIKDYDSMIRFVFLTGVSKFSKVSIFSGLNNLEDISIDPFYSALCGYTQSELETVFSPWIKEVDLAAVKEWYNGYGWGGEKVYNPFDILLFFKGGKLFRPHWFSTGTPYFLIELLKNQYRYLPEYENYEMRLSELESFDIGKIRFETLLFQTGYLTITDINETAGAGICHLSFPNTEVRSAFNQLVLTDYLLDYSPRVTPIFEALQAENIQVIEASLRALFASIANDNYRNNSIAQFEGFYATVIYAYLASLGFTLIAEDVTNTGRIDLTLIHTKPDGHRLVYIFEFKLTTATETNLALAQITDRNYPDKYRAADTTIHLIGIEFDPAAKNITAFDHTHL